MHNQDTTNLAEYNRRKEDKIMLDIELLKRQTDSLKEDYSECNRLLTHLLEVNRKEAEDRRVMQALEAEERKREFNHSKFLSRLGSITLSVLSIILGSFLGYFIPAYMSKH